MLGEMALACDVINNVTAAGGSPLQAIAAVETYFSHDGSADWCYGWRYDPKIEVLGDADTGYNSYTYQCCAEGTVYSSELPAQGSDEVLNPDAIPVPPAVIGRDCR